MGLKYEPASEPLHICVKNSRRFHPPIPRPPSACPPTPPATTLDTQTRSREVGDSKRVHHAARLSTTGVIQLFFSSLLLSSLEMSDTKVYEP